MDRSIAYVAYYRVSTTKQGSSGLGIEAQRAAIARHAGNSNILAEFIEIESGRRNERPELDRALAYARLHRVPVIVAKVDRLTRSVAFLSRLLEAGVEVCFADLPAIEGPTGRFILQQMASVAELEAGLISARTKAALAAAKERGKRLGGNRGAQISEKTRAAGRSSQSSRARQRASDIAVVIRHLQNSGKNTLSAVAAALTEQRIPTPRGRARWSPAQVSRIIERVASI
jgi:DNA invertase Pin-like site-specific DNA recombinase